MSTVVILQSSYIPWKGYFDLLGLADDFVIYDEAQFTKNDWRNRNQIKTSAGPTWLTIPVATSGRFGQSIRETRVANDLWSQRHWRSIEQAYGRAPFFSCYRKSLGELYDRLAHEPLLSEINVTLMRAIARWLGIRTVFHWSHELEDDPADDPTQRLVNLCRQLGCHYLPEWSFGTKLPG